MENYRFLPLKTKNYAKMCLILGVPLRPVCTVAFVRQRQILIAARADDSPFKKVDLKNAFANYALHFSLSAFYFVVGCQRDFLFGLVKVS